MVRNKLATAVLTVSVLQAGLVSALGLGEMQLNSTLNQPLNAEIRLLDTGSLDPSQIVVRLATTADFERAGVPRDYFLTHLRFTVELDGHGGGLVRLSTREPVIEPYLNFLLEARWPNGRLIREYTALMDLPRAAAPVREVRPPAGVSPEDRPRSQQAAQRPSRGVHMPEASSADAYRVQHNDTLSAIAARFRPADVTAEQTMLAIQRLNPSAFIDGNVNLVKSGYVLRMPTAEQARELDQEEARAELAAQTEAWRSGRAARQAARERPALDARGERGDSGPAGTSEAKLSIAAVGDSDRRSAGEGTGTSGGEGISALRDELAASQEGLDKARRESAELQSRVGDLERQIATLQRLIELKDDQLAALQAQLSEEPTGIEPDEAVDFNYESVAGEAHSATPSPTSAEPSGWRGFLSPLGYLVSGLAVLIMALLAVWAARRRSGEAALSLPMAAEEVTTEDGEHESLELAEDEFDEEEFEHIAASAEAPSGEVTAEAAQDSEALGNQPVHAETGDALAEADIYAAYGRYQQAADLLQTAISAEPERTDLRVKLLEIHAEAREKRAFQEQFMALDMLGDSAAIAQVKEYLSTLDGVSDWLDDLPVPTELEGNDALLLEEISEKRQEEEDGAFDEQGLDAVAAADLEIRVDDPEMWSRDAEHANTIEFETSVSSEDGGEPDGTAVDSELMDLDFSLHGDQSAAGDGLDLEREETGLALDELELENEDAFNLALAEAAVDELADLDLNLDRDSGQVLELDEDTAELLKADEHLLDIDSGSFGQPAEEEARELPLSDELSLDRGADTADWMLDAEQGSGGVVDSTTPFDGSAEMEEDASLQAESTLRMAEDSALADGLSPTPVKDPFALAAETGEISLDAIEFDADSMEEDADDDSFDFLGDTDEMATRLDLARAYIDMGDADGARDILAEVLQEGDSVQQQEAEALMERL